MARPLSKKARRAKVVEMLDVHRRTGLAHEPLLGFVRLLPGGLGTLVNVAGHEENQVDEIRRKIEDLWRTRKYAAEDVADKWTLEEITAAMVKAGIWPEKGML